MAILKVIEILSESTDSWEDAAKNAVIEASKTVKNIKSVYIENMTAEVADNKIVSWRLNSKITFEIEH